jgi:EpsI family protein
LGINTSGFVTRSALVGVLLLADSLALRTLSSPQENAPSLPPGLYQLPENLSSWRSVEQEPIPSEILSRLNPDDYLHRAYFNSSSKPGEPTTAADVFVGYFGSARSSNRPHSPEDCLPGSGWAPIQTQVSSLPTPGGASIEMSRLLLRKDSQRILVLFWFQHGSRTWPKESIARLLLIPEILQTNRSDLALVRIAIPMEESALPDLDSAISSLSIDIWSSLGNLFAAHVFRSR